jgi:hypothetical protein
MRATITIQLVLDLCHYGRDLLEQSASQPAEIRVFWVVDLSNTPRVYPGTNWLSINFNLFLRPNDGEGKKSLYGILCQILQACHNGDATYAEFAVVLDSLFVILLHVVGEVVDWNVVVLDVLHDLERKK